MSEQEQAPDVAITSSRWPSVVWLIPIVAAAIGAWLIYTTLSEKGPRITIILKSAEGLEAGKTFIKYKQVNIGLVESVKLADDPSKGFRVSVTADMDKKAGPYLTESSRFWVVVPRLTLKGVSGLGTLVSGAFIEMDPGKGGALKRTFVGLDEPPAIESDIPGTRFILTTTQHGSYSTDSPVYYRGIEVGEVLRKGFADDNRTIQVEIFIQAPHDKLVRDHSQFWNVSGINMSLGAEGMELKTESFRSILLGGIAFDTPETAAEGSPSKAGRRFRLYASEKEIKEAAYTETARYIAYFHGSARGLAIGAPVELRGIKIGEVIDVRLQFDTAANDFRVLVLMSVEAGRADILHGDIARTPETQKKRITALIDRGLRAQLAVGSLLTGKLLISLDFHPDTPAKFFSQDSPYQEIPTIPTQLEELTASLTELAKKLSKLPLKKLGDGLVRTVDGADRLINAPELHEAVVGLNSTMKRLDSLAKKLDKRLAPETIALVADARTALKSVNTIVSERSALRYDLATVLRELAAAARSIRSLASYLERNPNALIYGKTGSRGAGR